MIQNYELMKGSSGIGAEDIAHLLIPGRYRGEDGMGLSVISMDRVDTAAFYFTEHGLAKYDGVVVCSGYKNPGDQSGEPWSPEVSNKSVLLDGDVKDEEPEVYDGQPEAYGMLERLVSMHGISKNDVRVEPDSVDSVTNLAFSRNLFPDKRPIGIVAQEEHLSRILKIIAPRVLKQDFMGIIVPEVSQEDHDSKVAAWISRVVVRGLNPDTPNLEKITEQRIKAIWDLILFGKAIPEAMSQQNAGYALFK